jgi:hypothetical protein
MCHTNDEDDISYKMFVVEREGIGAPEEAMRKGWLIYKGLEKQAIRK